MSASNDNRVSVPPLLGEYWELLQSEDDSAVRLRAIRGLGQWLRAVEEAEIERAREAHMTWEEIGAAQDRPRQVVHRQASSRTPYRPNVRGLTSAEFEHVGTPDLRYWERWLSASGRAEELAKKGRSRRTELRRIRAEIEARERLRAKKK
jgi:hypothetical protein